MKPVFPAPFGDSNLATLAVLLSGRGSNFLALAQACRERAIPARIGLVLSDRPDAGGLERAREMGIPAVAVDRKGFASRDEHETAVLDRLEPISPDLVCLAGYMRLLSPRFVGRLEPRIVNIHPSLLPSFPGTHAQRQALEHGVRYSGCTVHLVDSGLDSGPIVGQAVVPVLPADDEEALSARILAEEHRLYVESVRHLLVRPWGTEGRRLVFGD